MAEATVAERGQGQGGLLAGKNCLVMGVQNRWSIAYAIGEAMAAAGARIALTYVDERAKRDADALIAKSRDAVGYACNVESDEELDALGEALGRDLGRVDALVHSIGFAPAAELQGRFLETSREGFRVTNSVSVYSLIAAAQRVVPLMAEGGSIMTLTYLGSERVFPAYKVMGVAKAALEATVRYLAADLGPQGIRVNAISAGPLKTAAARGIPGFADMHGQLTERTPLKGAFDAAKVAGSAVFLASDAAAAITGETLHVDNGYHVMGM
jgi:enoyl-[acyl-carrier protein] reductase I